MKYQRLALSWLKRYGTTELTIGKVGGLPARKVEYRHSDPVSSLALGPLRTRGILAALATFDTAKPMELAAMPSMATTPSELISLVAFWAPILPLLLSSSTTSCTCRPKMVWPSAASCAPLTPSAPIGAKGPLSDCTTPI